MYFALSPQRATERHSDALQLSGLLTQPILTAHTLKTASNHRTQESSGGGEVKIPDLPLLCFVGERIVTWANGGGFALSLEN